MRPRASSLFVAVAAFLFGYGYHSWNSRERVVSAKSTQRVLYYRCPMHPAYHSDKPGTAPCCHMALEPVYQEDEGAAARGGNLPAGAMHISPAQQQLIGLEYGVAEFGPAARTIRAAARVGVDESRLVRIQSKLEGFIDHLYVHAAGERVTQGQTLFTIYNRRAYAMPQMQFLQATMDASGMGAAPADASDPDRKRLADAEALRSARQQLEMAGFTEDQIQAVARAHQVLTSLPVSAPISGVILDFHAALNQKLDMEPLLAIADLSAVWVTADFLASDGSSIHSGQSARLAVPYLPDRSFRGTVDAVLPQLPLGCSSPRCPVRWSSKPEAAPGNSRFPRRRCSTAATRNGSSWISETGLSSLARCASASVSRGGSRS